MPPIHDPVEELRRQRLADAVDAYGTVPVIDPRPFEQLWRERIADFLMGEGRFAQTGEPPGQVDARDGAFAAAGNQPGQAGASGQPMMNQQAADEFYDRVGIRPASQVPGREPEARGPDRFIERPPAAPGRFLGLDAGQGALTAP